MKISVITLFPEMFETVVNTSILKRAQQKGKVEFKIINHREFGVGRHKIVDDKPYGGGAGMVLRVDVMAKAIESAKTGAEGERVVLLDPQGTVYRQALVEDFSRLTHLILVCGHYEGFDERIRNLVDMEVSVGDYVLTGGEIPAMAIIDSVTRLIPGVLKDEEATRLESHSETPAGRLLEGPTYTRPEVFEGTKVPDVLLSGDSKKIALFKRQQSVAVTQKRRPDLLDRKRKLTP